MLKQPISLLEWIMPVFMSVSFDDYNRQQQIFLQYSMFKQSISILGWHLPIFMSTSFDDHNYQW